MKTRTGLFAGAVLSLGLVTGCNGDGDTDAGTKATGTPKASASASAAAQPVYKGELIPGLAAKPAWSLGPKDGEFYSCVGDALDRPNHDPICTVGDAVLLLQDLSPEAEDADTELQTAHFVGHLYDAATGKERKTFTVKCLYTPDDGTNTTYTPTPEKHIQVGEWKDGSPAVLIRGCENTKASGLKAASVKTVYTMYDPSGAELGSSALVGEEKVELPVVRGHVLLPEDDSDDRSYAPIGGGKELVLPAEFAEQTVIGTGQGYVTEGDGVYDPVSVIDRNTGKTLWSTTELTPPNAVVKQLDDDGEVDAELYPLRGDQALLVWSASGSNDAVITTVDLPTGDTVAAGPQTTLEELTRDRRPVVSPDGKTAVVNFTDGAVAWNTQTGAELWRQAADEKDITPGLITPRGVLYAGLDNETGALAMGTKELIGMLPMNTVPDEFTTNGYTLVQDTEGHFFAFKAEKA
ncbi:PQQ-binding-like beta-propeller repeat protein [Streptomyces tailanensis]|uniref:outer membrane protein assembly factor BamB family protein n=1 Tax=Streptomyces tailanensis TaxID=2569858 RepID=UPI00122E3283|nr:PQQ-binding-like beta-propeller repeat protein [Streptomyces tailanensis]